MSSQKHEIRIGPQLGPQTQFLSCSADIVLYGGAAGGGKTFGLLLDPLRYVRHPFFGGVIFRRSTTQIRNEGGLWDESVKLYSLLKAEPVESFLEWTFTSGARMKFAHLEYDKTVLDWHGSQIPWMGFDELVLFSEYQFFYMLSRNRSPNGIQSCVRATCNPDYNSWVRQLIDWWIGEDGFPIIERAGKMRWFIRQNDEMIWGNTRQELIDRYGADELPMSFTFIPSTIYDNKILLAQDKKYLANLKALPRIERLRLLGGNWNVRATAGMFFQRESFEVIDALPANPTKTVRYWDKAATKPSETNKDPDWTAGVKLHAYPNGTYVVEHVGRLRESPLKVEQFVRNTATQDGVKTQVCVEQDPGSAGVADADNYVRLLAGFDVRVRKPTTDKVTRALPVSAQCEQGNVKILRGSWNKDFLDELENFEEGCPHDDQVDGFSGAFNEMCSNVSILDVL